MLRRAAALLLVLAVPASAATTVDFASLSETAAQIRADLAEGRLRARNSAHAAPAKAPAPAPKRVALLRCWPVDGRAFGGFTFTLDLETHALNVAEKDARPLLDAKLGDTLVDSRCGKTALPVSTSANWEVTGRHVWGQYLLQVPDAVVEAGRTATFEANLHSCDYDGSWSSSEDRRLKCDLLVP